MDNVYAPTPEEHFEQFPEDEEEFIEEYIRLHYNDELVDYPEDWVTSEWIA